jgi:uncharacterized protein (TIGR02118 family)
MSVKVVVLYPHPVDADAFETLYHGRHMPLMRRLVGSSAVPTFKAVRTGRDAPPFYRMAEIHFADRAELDAFVGSVGAELARRSAEEVSTGGGPIVFVCERDR